MSTTKEIGVIGLGKFGLQLGTTLMEQNHRVIGVDSDPERVRVAQETFSQAYVANATEKAALTQLRFQDLDLVAVSVGDSMETSILTTLNLQEIGVKNIMVKAVSPAHRKVLKRLGAQHVIQPEIDVARLTAYRISNPGMLDFLPVGGGVLVQELEVDEWAGKSLIDLNLRDARGVLVAAVRGASDKEYRFVPDPKKVFEKGDKLLLIGKQEGFSGLKT